MATTSEQPGTCSGYGATRSNLRNTVSPRSTLHHQQPCSLPPPTMGFEKFHRILLMPFAGRFLP